MTREEALVQLRLGPGINEDVTEEYDEATDMAIIALERYSIIDKIKADIFNACSDNYHMAVNKLSCEQIFDIIDKYNVESEVKNEKVHF